MNLDSNEQVDELGQELLLLILFSFILLSPSSASS